MPRSENELNQARSLDSESTQDDPAHSCPKTVELNSKSKVPRCKGARLTRPAIALHRDIEPVHLTQSVEGHPLSVAPSGVADVGTTNHFARIGSCVDIG